LGQSCFSFLIAVEKIKKNNRQQLSKFQLYSKTLGFQRVFRGFFVDFLLFFEFFYGFLRVFCGFLRVFYVIVSSKGI
jgi:hypothetical protein